MNVVPNPLEELSLEELRTRTSVKWRAYPDDVLPLWVAEMDVRPAPAIVRAVRAAMEAGDTGYPFGTAYAEAVAEFAANRWGWHGVEVERTAVMPDVMSGVSEILRLVTSPGDPVVVNTPGYPPFFGFTEHAGRRVVEAPLGADLRLDLGSLRAAFDRAREGRGKSLAYLLGNPHNPTGVAHTRAELLGVAELAREYDVRVVVDEIHGPLVLPGAVFVPYLSVPGTGNGLALTSASKGWNLAGLKAALLIGGEEAAEDLDRMPEVVGHGVSHLGVIAHTAALREAGDWLDALLAGLDQNRQLLTRLLAQELPAVGFRAPDASYLAWLDCRSLGLDDGDVAAGRGNLAALVGPAQTFLDKARVALSPGSAFGGNGAGHVRLNFATSGAILVEAVQRMATFIDR